MAPKIISAIITFLINIASAMVILFAMLVAMNGYSESDAMWGLGVYTALVFAASIVMGFGAFLTTGFLQKRQYGAVPSVLIAVILFAFIGFLADGLCGLIGVGVAEFVRVNF